MTVTRMMNGVMNMYVVKFLGKNQYFSFTGRTEKLKYAQRFKTKAGAKCAITCWNRRKNHPDLFEILPCDPR